MPASCPARPRQLQLRDQRPFKRSAVRGLDAEIVHENVDYREHRERHHGKARVIVGFIENLFGIQFMTVYFINYFPTDIRVPWIASICAISFVLACIASVYPANIASKVEPAEALKYE